VNMQVFSEARRMAESPPFSPQDWEGASRF
jgi:hypothetical protein